MFIKGLHCSTHIYFFLICYIFPQSESFWSDVRSKILGTQFNLACSVDCVFFCVSSATQRNLKRPVFQRRALCRSCGRRPVGVAQHGVEGAGKVVGAGATGRVLRQRDQTRQQEEEEQEQLQREGGAERPIEEGARRRGVLLLSAGANGRRRKVETSFAGWNRLRPALNKRISASVSVTSWGLSLSWSSRPLLRQRRRQPGLMPSHHPGENPTNCTLDPI